MNSKPYKIVALSLLAFSAFLGINANAGAGQELRWETIVGIKQSGDVVGVGTGKITGGAPWETLGGSVDVNLKTGEVNFDVTGLILAVGALFESGGTDFSPSPTASGLPIGTPAGITAVKGTLVCNVTGDQGPNSVSVDTPVTTLDSQGNAHFLGIFSGSIPSECSKNAF